MEIVSPCHNNKAPQKVHKESPTAKTYKLSITSDKNYNDNNNNS
jgi:hypothetical protein